MRKGQVKRRKELELKLKPKIVRGYVRKSTGKWVDSYRRKERTKSKQLKITQVK